MNPKVDAHFDKMSSWQKESRALRKLALESGLTEELKWGQPCYALDGKNVFLIHGFKEYFALLFMKGALMEDPAGILIQQTGNVQSARQIRFTKLEEVTNRENILTAYIQDAIKVEKSGAKVEKKTTAEFEIVPEFQAKLDEMPDLRTAFQALTPGRQRGYLLHFSSAKQSKTREARVEKLIPKILAGKGFDD